MTGLAPGQLRVRGLTLGPGTPYIVTSFNPWQRQARSEAGGARAWGHGGWSGAEWADEKVIPLTIEVGDPAGTGTDWLDADGALAAAFAPVGDSGEQVALEFNWAGRELMCFGRPRMVEPDNWRPGLTASTTQAAFVALDPLIYDGVDRDPVAVGLPSFEGGLSVPFTVPFTVPGVMVDGQADLVNAGTAEVGLRFTVAGPVAEPRVSLLRPDGEVQTLRFRFGLDAAQWVEVDTAARTVLLNGLPQASRRGQVSGEFPLLPAGTSTLHFRAAVENEQAQVQVFPPFSAWW